MSIHAVRPFYWAALRVCCIAVITVLASCARKQPAADTTSAAESTSSQFSLLTLERRPCFGTCPVYQVSITSDGVVTFDGKRFVDSVGQKTSRIDQGKVKALQAFLDDHQFSAFDDKYGYGLPNCKRYASDAPTVIISVTTKTQVKRVEHDGGCMEVPSRLADLEHKIDSVVNVARYLPKQGK